MLKILFIIFITDIIIIMSGSSKQSVLVCVCRVV